MSIFNFAADQNIFDALGLDWKMLLLQAIGFLILVLVLAKWIFPIFNKVIDERESRFQASAEAAEQAKLDAESAEKRIAKELEAAKKTAAETLEVARTEAAAMLSAAEDKAKKRSKHIIDSAQASLEQDVAAAREALRTDMKNLVADATEVIVHQKLDKNADAALINEALSRKGAKA